MLHNVNRDHILKVLWENSLVGVAIVDPGKGAFKYANPTFCRIVEYTEAELQKMTFHDITDPRDVEADVEMAKRSQTGDINRYDMEKRYITKTGRLIWVKLRAVLIHIDGKPEFFVSQVSTVLTLVPPKAETEYIGNQMPKLRTYLVYWIKNNWPWVAAVGASVAYLTAETIKNLKQP